MTRRPHYYRFTNMKNTTFTPNVTETTAVCSLARLSDDGTPKPKRQIWHCSPLPPDQEAAAWRCQIVTIYRLRDIPFKVCYDHGPDPDLPMPLRPHPAAHAKLLLHGPLCVCHFQKVLGEPQVKVSKHLAYLKSMVWSRQSASQLAHLRLVASQHCSKGKFCLPPGLR